MRLACAALIGGLLASTSAPATPASLQGCELVTALAAPGTRALRGIRIEADSAGLIDLSYRSKPTLFAGATQCEISGPSDMFDVRCRWEHELDLAAAQRRHARLLAALTPCLPGGLTKQAYAVSVEGLSVSEYHKGELEFDDQTVIAEVQINTFLDKGEPEMHEVSLSIRR